MRRCDTSRPRAAGRYHRAPPRRRHPLARHRRCCRGGRIQAAHADRGPSSARPPYPSAHSCGPCPRPPVAPCRPGPPDRRRWAPRHRRSKRCGRSPVGRRPPGPSTGRPRRWSGRRYVLHPRQAERQTCLAGPPRPKAVSRRLPRRPRGRDRGVHRSSGPSTGRRQRKAGRRCVSHPGSYPRPAHSARRRARHLEARRPPRRRCSRIRARRRCPSPSSVHSRS